MTSQSDRARAQVIELFRFPPCARCISFAELAVGHEVIHMEVCRFKSESNCRIGTDADWIPFDEWLGEDEGDGDQR